jgi:hypothetical protein
MDYSFHRLVPACLDQLAVLADERSPKTVGGVVGLPAEEVFGIESPLVDPIYAATPYPDDAPVFDGDIQSVAVRV